MDGYKQMAVLLKALAHPVRLQILQVLREDEACVCHLEAVLGLRQAYISQQLMRLREDGLVVDRREGMNVFYSLADEAIAKVLDVAQEAAVRLAQARGEQPVPASFQQRTAVSCSCPRCKPKVAEVNQAYNLESR